MTTTTGFIATVCRPDYGGGDFTNRGATAVCEHVIVEHPAGTTIQHRGNYKLPVMQVEVRRGGAFGDGYTTLKPAPGYENRDNPADLCGPMAGGNWIEPEGDLLAAIGNNAGHARDAGKIPIHDRYETWAQYDALTR